MSSLATAFPVSAAQAARSAQDEAKRMNAQRMVPKLPRQQREFSEANTVHIYNVGPWQYERHLGSAGRFVIPARKTSEPYARMEPIPGIPLDLAVKDERSMELLMEEEGGAYLAQQIMMVGAFFKPSSSLAKRGCFIGSEIGPKAKPTKQELAEAEEALLNYAIELVEEIRAAELVGPKALEETRQDKHYWAAEKLNLTPATETWMNRVSIANTAKRCDGCGEAIEGTPIRHKCGFILDKERYDKNKHLFA